MKPLPTIHLRAMEPEDLDLLYRIENDEALWALGMTNVPYSRYVLHDYIDRATGDIYADKQVRLVMENAEGETVGIIDLTNFDPKNQRAEVGIVVMNAHRRQGYATAAMRQLHRYAQATLHLHQLYAVIPADNAASRRLFLAMDYRERAPLADWLYDGCRHHDAVMMQHIFQNTKENQPI